MSMRTYAVDSYGLILNEDEIYEIFAEKERENDFNIYDVLERLEEYCDTTMIDDDYEGEFLKLDSYRCPECMENVNSNTAIIIETDKTMKLIGTAYSSIEEIIEEMKRKVGSFLPENFDYESHIGRYLGTTFG